MTLRFLCPLGHRLAVPDHLAGKKGRCPVCKQKVYIPELAAVAEQSPPSGDSVLDDPAEFVIDEESTGRSGLGSQIGSPAAEAEMPLEIPASHIHEPEVSTLAPPPAPALSPALHVRDVPLEGYRPEAARLRTVYFLAAALAAVAFFTALPALRHLNLSEAPNWARAMLLLAGLQIFYAAWMASLPDWSTVWFGMLTSAVAAALYGVVLAAIEVTSAAPGEELILGVIAEQRRTAGGWCAVAMLLSILVSYLCGRTSGRWQRSYAQAQSRLAGKSTRRSAA